MSISELLEARVEVIEAIMNLESLKEKVERLIIDNGGKLPEEGGNEDERKFPNGTKPDESPKPSFDGFQTKFSKNSPLNFT